MTNSKPGSERNAFMTVDALWKSLEEIEKMRKKIMSDQNTTTKLAFYNQGNRKYVPPRQQKTKPLFAAAEDSESDISDSVSMTGEVFVRGNLANDDW